MKLLVTRIKKGKVKVGGEVKASVDEGLAVFAGIEAGDTETELLQAVKKIINLRVFEDGFGRITGSVKDNKRSILCVPNFTLCASTKKGRRPSFEAAMEPPEAKKMFTKLVAQLKKNFPRVKAGIFGAHMDISLELDGPVNITLSIP